ncbi:2-methylcitrate dehydratase PrpD [Paraburkholderia sp. GAS199]|uniref:MmgE/PrpD family protein n=1 Tax=Paraburkholderia sp. GAS199 TaxID=3035126 RepID=UPI003D1EBEBB
MSEAAYHEELARMAVGVRLADMGASTRSALLDTVIDTVGCAIAAAAEPFADAALRATGAAYGGGTCSVLGRSERVSPSAAAMINATLGHGYDFDDVHLPSLSHFSTIVIPAALAACEMERASGATFLEAVIAGDEVGGRIGWAACSTEWGGTSIRNRSFFPTAILGTLAAAVAVAKVFGLSVGQTAQAIAIAGSYAAGLASVSRGDNSTKRTQAGWAAQSGLNAALLAREGFTGPRSVLETPQGFFEAFTGNRFRPEALRRNSDDTWICEEMSFKHYPLEYIIHPLVELTGRARDTVLPLLSDVTRIEASATARFVTLFEPVDTKTAPADAFQALMSAPYCIARALTKAADGNLWLSDFREHYVCDDATRALARKVAFVPDASFDARFPLHIDGGLKVLCGETVVWEGRIDDVYGSLDRPMSEAHFLGKFRSNCAALPAAQVDAMLDTLRHVDEAPDAGWIGLMRAGPA